MEAGDWLRDMEGKMTIAQCSYHEKVLYAPHYLTGDATSCWQNILRVHPDENSITWAEFKESFHGAHIPISVMKIKKKEFEDLKQRSSSVMEYVDQYNQLSRYASEDYKTEERRMEKFLDGLALALKCQLVVLMFPDFKTLVNKAIMLEVELAARMTSANTS